MTVPQYNLLGRASYGESVLLSLYTRPCANFGAFCGTAIAVPYIPNHEVFYEVDILRP